MKISMIAASVLTIAAAAGAANGITIMQTQNFNGVPDFVRTLTFNKYAGPASDIISIKVKLQLDTDGGILQLDNDGEGPAVGVGNVGANGAISSVDVPLVQPDLSPLTAAVSTFSAFPFALAADNGNDPFGTVEPDAPGFDYAQFNGGQDTDMNMGFINPLAFASYAGGGTYDIDVDVDQFFNAGGVSGVSFGGSGVTASGNVMVIYEIIPAPGAFALLGLGGLVAARRRRA